MTGVGQFASGVAMASFLGSGLYFVKFWRGSHDRFYLWFAAAFLLLAVERVVLLAVGADLQTVRTPATDLASSVYVIRLLAFVAIGVAIAGKNRQGGST